MDEIQIEKKDAGLIFRKYILNEDPFEQFQNRDVETNGDVNIARNI